MLIPLITIVINTETRYCQLSIQEIYSSSLVYSLRLPTPLYQVSIFLYLSISPSLSYYYYYYYLSLIVSILFHINNRCIKPNDDKRALFFNDKKCQEQCRYLGLLENLRVRRAGYCYRQTYEKWISRYYMISDKTFPKSKWRGDVRAGVQLLVDSMNLPQGEVQFGKT